ncbi:MAG: anti-sigma factor [Holophagales bacterium]|nr:anti-sigma factor [Holophagales bacterium]
MLDHTDHPESPDPETGERQAAEKALDLLATGWDPQSPDPPDGLAGSSPPESDGIREQVETLAYLAYALDPTTPKPGARAELLDRIRAEPNPTTHQPAVSAQAAAAVIPFREAAPAPAPHWSTLALAAGLAFCLVGLGYLYSQLNTKDAVIALQQQRLESVPDFERELRNLRDDLRTARDRLNMVDTVARQAYPMRAVSTLDPASNAAEGRMGAGVLPNGRIYVCGAHQQWYLTLAGLEPVPEGKEYRLWFMTSEGPVDGGALVVEEGTATMRDLSMPDHTDGFTITLESIGSGDSPIGQMIMIGDDPISL